MPITASVIWQNNQIHMSTFHYLVPLCGLAYAKMSLKIKLH